MYASEQLQSAIRAIFSIVSAKAAGAGVTNVLRRFQRTESTGLLTRVRKVGRGLFSI